ncbi:MAG: ChaN family lipoprotein [Deltaproteobacteria bacterium]|nr:ChaN family lipoprotein [Deltaproteobacteria bacterium]
MLTRHALCFFVAAATFGCGGKYGGGNSGTTTPAKPGTPKGGLAMASLPYQVLDRGGRTVDEAAFWAYLQKARAVCVGEDHPNPHHHWVQLRVVEEIGKRKPAKLGLGLEMIQRPFQGPLDDYSAKRIDAAALRSRVGWEERWGYDWEFYGPTIDAAIQSGASVIALNASKELSKKISRQGLDSLTPEEKANVPELKLDDATHRAWFDGLMSEMGGAGAHSQKKEGDPAEVKPDPHKEKENPHKSPHGAAPPMPSAERIYTVQVLWDETMADLSAKWLAANPSGQLVILAGNGHCHDSAIVARLKRRGVADVVSVRPVIDTEGEVARVLAKPMNDYVVVMQLPAGTK